MKKNFLIKMKTTLVLMFMTLSIVSLFSCDDDEEEEPETPSSNLVGQDGNPRFNLSFTNSQNVDLDLYVKAPNGTVIYYSNPTGAGGTLDVDCLCDGCPQGPNENIFWQNGSAPSGEYRYWVKYYGSCDGGNASSNYTLRVIKNGEVITTKTGTLSSGQSSQFIHNQN